MQQRVWCAIRRCVALTLVACGIALAPQVRDKEGRRRFHGAFTGGFSAGYYNTVGSAEGWTPSQFTSSRDKRAGPVAQRPEDFMDEDDDPLLGRKLSARAEFDTLGQRAEARARSTQATAALGRTAIPGPLPSELVVPSAVPVGKKLLRCMGWREGQGVGPRALRKSKKQRKRRQKQREEARKAREAALAAAQRSASGAGGNTDEDSDATPPRRTQASRVYTVALPPGVGGSAGPAVSDSDDSDDPYAAGILFAPENAKAVKVQQKVGARQFRWYAHLHRAVVAAPWPQQLTPHVCPLPCAEQPVRPWLRPTRERAGVPSLIHRVGAWHQWGCGEAQRHSHGRRVQAGRRGNDWVRGACGVGPALGVWA